LKIRRDLFETLLITQPKMSTGSTGSKASEFTRDPVDVISEEILKQLPEPLVDKNIEDPNSLEVFRAQEVSQFNRLLG
jgi:hypothetical protein